ncbi:hypothetical protein Hanom_Chr01g00052461 [Helianthus anomalus]
MVTTRRRAAVELVFPAAVCGGERNEERERGDERENQRRWSAAALTTEERETEGEREHTERVTAVTVAGNCVFWRSTVCSGDGGLFRQFTMMING